MINENNNEIENDNNKNIVNNNKENNPQNKQYDYQWEELYDNRTPTKNINNFKQQFGPIVIKRNNDNQAEIIRFQILLQNKNWDVFLVGNFNNWGNISKEELNNYYKFTPDEHYNIANLEINNSSDFYSSNPITHKTQYKLLIKPNEKSSDNFTPFYIEDPAASYFTDEGNCVFWDFKDPSTYQQQYNLINTFDRTTRILQTDLPGLITHFANQEGKCGKDITEQEYYQFIIDSGIIPYIKELGYNTIQFLPFAQNIDGTNWKFRYLVPFQYAIQKNWGNPDQFAQMIDEFHKHDIAVIGDFVLGHIPDRDFEIFGQSSKEHGIHLWKNTQGFEVFLKDETSWGTRRIDFDNPYARQFFRESCTFFMKNYKIDGFRIDNIDGIIRFGASGQGDERENGRQFLREINEEIYNYNPAALVHYEAHYYYGDNAKMLVAPIKSDNRALGATCYNSSRITYYFHTKYMFLGAKENSIWKIKHITEEKEWGKSNSTIADFHNHDAAAGLMSNRCTGSYAYDCMMEMSPSNHIHAIGKIKTMEALISFATEGRTLDLAQTHLLQTGTFEHDSSIRWDLAFNEVNRNTQEFKKQINLIMENPAFWPININKREFLNIDDNNKIIVISRSSDDEEYVIVVNMSDWKHHNYKIGVKNENNYKCIFNSDEFRYAGFGMTNFNSEMQNNPSNNFELLTREFEIPVIPPYAVLVFKRV